MWETKYFDKSDGCPEEWFGEVHAIRCIGPLQTLIHGTASYIKKKKKV
jgi:hypothetical protein